MRGFPPYSGAKIVQTDHLWTSLQPTGAQRVFHAGRFAPEQVQNRPAISAQPTFVPVQIHRGLPHFPPGRKRIVTTGTFDGVHLGHRALLDWMVREARTGDAETVVLTFDPHPRQVLFGDASGLKLIQSLDQRAECLALTGLDHLVVQPFDRAFSRLRPEDFVRDVLVEGLGTTTIVVGHDHRFGAGREGDVDLLKACGETYGFNVMHIPAHIEGEMAVSSTKIRQRIGEGDLSGARALIGRDHAWRGRVVTGEGRGRALGYRTANLHPVEPLQLLPADGVYAARVRPVQSGAMGAPAGGSDDGNPSWDAMVHVGRRPTFDEEDAPMTVEAHLFEAGNPDLYGREVEVAFVRHLRDVRKFDSPASLIDQLGEDAKAAREALGYAG